MLLCSPASLDLTGQVVVWGQWYSPYRIRHHYRSAKHTCRTCDLKLFNRAGPSGILRWRAVVNGIPRGRLPGFRGRISFVSRFFGTPVKPQWNNSNNGFTGQATATTVSQGRRISPVKYALLLTSSISRGRNGLRCFSCVWVRIYRFTECSGFLW